jgi:Ca-activated chloride channel family protein
LRQLATAGGGAYTAISSGNHDVRYLLSKKMTTDAGERTEQPGMHTDRWQSNGPWLAVLLLPLAALAFRRGWLLVVVLVVGGTISAPQPAMALGWDDLWLRPDQQAARALQAGEPERAAQLARDPALRGTAEYQAGNYAAAQQAFASQTDADADYNQGNALAQLQRYEEALAAYDRALQKQPQMADALHNKAEIEKLLQQQQEQQQDQQQDESGDDADNQQGQQDQGSGDNQQDAQKGEQGSDESQGEQQNDAAEQGDEERNDARQDADSATAEQQAVEGEDPAEAAQQSADAQDAADAEGDSSSAQQAGEEAGQAAEQQATASAEPLDSEEQRAAEQWLRRIPDDPGGLLQRKFLYQYKQRAAQSAVAEQQAW